MIFLQKPLSATLLAITVLMVVGPWLMKKLKKH
jgi:TctA family transporter